MKICCRSVFFTIILFLPLINACVKDGIDSCASQSIHVYFYSKTTCETDTIYSSSIQPLWIGLFDEEEILISHTTLQPVSLTKDYYYEITSPNTGAYTIMAWGGLNAELLELQTLQNGMTTKKDLFFRLRRIEGQYYSLEGEQFFYGESPVIHLEKNQTTEPLIVNTSVNLQELTNRITVTINGLTGSDRIDMVIQSTNGSVNIDGSNGPDELIEYHPEYNTGQGSVNALFTIMRLDAGQTNTLIISDTKKHTEIFNGDLLNELLLQNPEVNISCDHDFFITINVEDQGAYILTEIWVNDWLVHSYNKEM